MAMSPPSETGSRSLAPVEASYYTSVDPDHEIDLRNMGRGVVRSRWLIVGIAVGMIGLGAFFTWLQTPEYEAEATLHVEVASPQSGLASSFGAISGLGALAGTGSGSLATEIAVLQSRNIAEAVADSLALRVQLLEPEMSRAAILEVVAAPRDTAAGVYEFTLRDDGRYEIRAREEAPEPRPAIATIGEPVQIAGTTIRLLASSGIDSPPELIRIAVHSFRDAVEGLRDGLDVGQIGDGAQVVSIRMRHSDPFLAAAIPNTAAHSYVEYKTLTETSDAGNSVRFLQEQVDRYSAELAQAEARLQEFSEDERIVHLPSQASAQIEQVADLQARRDMLATELAALREILAQTEAAPSDPTAPSPYRRLATFPTFLSNGIVQNLVSSLTELETERSELLARFTPKHPDVERANERIGELESQLYQIASNYVESLNTQIGSMNTMLERFGGELEAAPARQVEYARLRREQAMLEEIYTLLETRLTEARIREAGEPIDVRLLDAALIPDSPVSPRPLMTLLLAAATGLMLGLGVAVFRALLDPRIRNRNDVLAAAGGVPVIGAIPRLWSAPSGNGKLRLRAGSDEEVATTHRTGPTDPHLVTFHNPASPAAEAYRGLRTSVTLLSPEHSPRVIVATSAMPGEGKSISASNLAVALAQQGIRTLLIDADLRQGGLHHLFGISREPGLADVLVGRTTLADAVREVAVSQHGVPLDLLVSGGAPPNPSELLGSVGMKELLDRLRGRYDMIVLDAPPLRLVTDAAVLGTFADSTLLIARAGTTHKRALGEAAAELRRLNIPLRGIVVNDVEGSEMAEYRYGYNPVDSP